MHTYLKIKIMSLAAEATMIHREERRHNVGHRGRVRARRMLARSNDLTDTERQKLTRKLIAPSDRNLQIFWGLRYHRTGEVRSEARSALIAYGFLRGLSYSKVETNPKSVPDWTRVKELVRKYGEDNLNERMARFDEWMKQAQK